MNATAEQLDNYLREADPATAQTVEQIVSLVIQRFKLPTQTTATAHDQGMAALKRIAARGGIAGITDPAAWQREQRADRPLPGREP